MSIESDQLGSRFRGNPGLRNLVSETVGDQWNAAYGGLSRTHLDTVTCGTELQNSSVTRGGDGDRVRPPGGYHTAGIAPPAGPVQFGSAVDAWPPDGSKFIMFSESESTPTCRGRVHLLVMSVPLLISHTQTETVSPTTKSGLSRNLGGQATAGCSRLPSGSTSQCHRAAWEGFESVTVSQ